MFWCVTTQAAFSVHAKLYDNQKTYFDNTRQNTEIDPPLAIGSDFMAGTGLKLLIEETQSQSIDASINTYNITRNDGSIIGYGYNISIEDSTDADYNDVSITLISWKSKG